MAKIIDRIIFVSLLFIIFTLWIIFLSKDVALAICISVGLCIIITILIKPKTPKVKIKAEEYIPKLSSMSKTELNNLILGVLSEKCNPKINEKNLLIINENQLILPIIRMSEISVDEIRRLSNSTQKLGYTKLILVIGTYDKVNFPKIIPYLSVPVEILSVDNLIVSLNKINALPQINKKLVKKQKWKELFAKTLRRKNGKFFLFSGLTMAFLSVFTPLTFYYLTFSTVTLILAGLCLLKKTEQPSSVLK